MNYSDGIVVEVGDLVRLNGDEIATVVGIVEDGRFLPGFNVEEWRYLKRGALIESVKYGLFHYEELGGEIVFLNRGTKSIPR